MISIGRSFSLALAAAVLISRAAVGQSGATDNELHAAYCKGVLGSLISTSATASRPIDPALSASNREIVQRLRADTVRSLTDAFNRFSAYLLATGVLTDPARSKAIFGLSTAMTRGQADQRQCAATTEACSDAILGRPGTPAPRDDRSQQLFACLNRDPTCPNIRRCVSGDGLPF